MVSNEKVLETVGFEPRRESGRHRFRS